MQAPKEPTLSDAKTFADVMNYVHQEADKIRAGSLDSQERAVLLGNILLPASIKMLELAENPLEKRMAYELKFSALAEQAAAGVEGAEQKFETFFEEFVAMEEFKQMKDRLRFAYLMMRYQYKGFEAAEAEFNVFIKELEAKEESGQRTDILNSVMFSLFAMKAEAMEPSVENFAQFVTELKTWIDNATIPFSSIVTLAFQTAQKNEVPAVQIVNDLTEHIQTSEMETQVKTILIETLEKAIRLAPGEDPKFYGKTLDGNDFDWESLRGQYVLIKYTATWCGPCKMQIPSMMSAYVKYKDKGLEIVSVYMWEHSDDPAAAVKAVVKAEKLPWIILSEALTEETEQPAYGNFYAVSGVPMFVLTDKEGKVMMPASHGDEWKEKLKEIFE